MDLSSGGSTQQTSILKSIIQHSEFDPFSLSYDIALLELTVPLVFDTNTQAIAMPSIDQIISSDCIASGWGAVTEGGDVNDLLQQVTLPVVDDATCKATYGETEIYDHMICLGEAGKDSCQGDTGGPLTCTNSDQSSFLGGIYSTGYGCGRPSYPGIYTEMSYFVQWIADQTGS